MEKLKIHIINYKNIFNDLSISVNYRHLEEYLNGGRQDILENFDIFCENIRSKDKKYKNFDVFEIVNEINVDTVVVIGFYLELLEFWGQRSRIYDIVKYYSEKYRNNIVVGHWNHDIDAANVFTFMEEFPNFYLLNFNTSSTHDRSIVLPFWSIEEKYFSNEKTIFANLVCSINNNLRKQLFNTFLQNPNFFVSERISYDKFVNVLSNSTFTLSPKGVGLSSYRFFECFNFNTIPVLFADNVVLPFKNKIDYDNCIVRIEEKYANNQNYIISKLEDVDCDKYFKNLEENREKISLKGIQEHLYNTFKK